MEMRSDGTCSILNDIARKRNSQIAENVSCIAFLSITGTGYIGCRKKVRNNVKTCLLCKYFWECIFRSEKGACDRFER